MSRPRLQLCALVFLSMTATVSIRAAQDDPTQSSSPLCRPNLGRRDLPPGVRDVSPVDGAGQPQTVVGFQLPLPNGHDFPDFNDCPTNTVEPLADWIAVVHRGGPIRGLDRHMPAFGDALTQEQIERAVKYLWSFCRIRPGRAAI